MPSPTESKKIFLVTAILVILLIGIFFLRFQRNASLKVKEEEQAPPSVKTVSPTPLPEKDLSGIYTITVVPSTIKPGASFTAAVSFVAESRILDGADAVIKYDPAFLSANTSTLATSDYFTLYPRKEVDNTRGIIKVTGITAKDSKPITALTSFFSIAFQAKKQGTTTITFDYTPGTTSKSTLVEHKTSKNILGRVEEAEVVIEK